MKRNDEVARSFVDGWDGKNANMHTSYDYDGNGRLYSYYTEIAERQLFNGDVVFFTNDMKYSRTTSRHQSILYGELYRAGYAPTGERDWLYVGGWSQREVPFSIWSRGGVPTRSQVNPLEVG